MRSRVYVTVGRPSVRPSFCPVDRQLQRQSTGLLLSTLLAGDISRPISADALRRRAATVLFRPDRGAEYCDERVCLCVCLSLRDHISELHVRSSSNFSCA